ncbi:MAG: ABC transporter permease subunit [Bacilli bacterium]|nr:ABC transporter permease subunit [Bacilli bacterium]
MSKGYKEYLNRNKRYNILIVSIQILIIISFLFLWEYGARKELIDSFITSSPTEIIETIINLIKSNNLFNHIIITIIETVISFILGTLIGIIIASILWYYKTLAKVVDPFLTLINSLPKIALGPIIIIWAGAGIKSIIIMALLISTIVTIINIYQGFIDTDELKIKLMKTFKASKIQIYTNLVLPNSFTNIISTLKINISMSLIGIIMGEFLVSKQGIGYLIMYGSQIFNLDLVMTGILILSILSLIMYYLILYLEKIIIKKSNK